MTYDEEVQGKLDLALGEWLARFLGAAIRQAPREEWPPPAGDLARIAIPTLTLKTEDGRFVKMEPITRLPAPEGPLTRTLYCIVEAPDA